MSEGTGPTQSELGVIPESADSEFVLRGIDMLPTRTAMTLFREDLQLGSPAELAQSFGIKKLDPRVTEFADRVIYNFFTHSKVHPYPENNLPDNKFGGPEAKELYNKVVFKGKHDQEIAGEDAPAEEVERWRTKIGKVLKIDQLPPGFDMSAIIGPNRIVRSDLVDTLLKMFPGETPEAFETRLGTGNADKLRALQAASSSQAT